MPEYNECVKKLETIGKPDVNESSTWKAMYAKFEFTYEDVSDLIHLLKAPAPADLAMLEADELELPTASYAQVHAWRVLGVLGAVEGISVLIEIMKRDEWEDWGWSEIPYVMAMIGEPALDPLQVVFASSAYSYDSGATNFLSCLVEIANKHADLKNRVIAIISQQLQQASSNDMTVNGFIISELMSLGGVSALDVIEAAFDTENVDLSIAGDWDDVQVYFGLKEPDPDKINFSDLFGSSNPGRSVDPKKKSKRKAAKKQKQKARRRKKK